MMIRLHSRRLGNDFHKDIQFSVSRDYPRGQDGEILVSGQRIGKSRRQSKCGLFRELKEIWRGFPGVELVRAAG